MWKKHERSCGGAKEHPMNRCEKNMSDHATERMGHPINECEKNMRVAFNIWQTASSGLNFAAIEENIHNAPQTWYMSCKIMLILTVRPLAFQGYTILHITYLKKFQKLEFFEKNRKKSRNSRFLLMTIFSMLFANSFNSQGHLIAKKKICGRGYIITCAAFFSFWEKMILSTQTCCE